MKNLLLNVCAIICLYVLYGDAVKILSRVKRGAYDLPDGWYHLRESITPSFECQEDGYYADIDNGCQLYHVCQFINLPYSKPRFLQYSFICGNGTVFNQLTQTCTFESQLSVPCESSGQFFYMNKRIGALGTWFHTGEDYQRIRSVNNDNKFNSILRNAENSGSRSPGVTNLVDENDDPDEDF